MKLTLPPEELNNLARTEILYILLRYTSSTLNYAQLRLYCEQCLQLCKKLLQELYDSPNAPVGEEGLRWHWVSQVNANVGVMLYEAEQREAHNNRVNEWVGLVAAANSEEARFPEIIPYPDTFPQQIPENPHGQYDEGYTMSDVPVGRLGTPIPSNQQQHGPVAANPPELSGRPHSQIAPPQAVGRLVLPDSSSESLAGRKNNPFYQQGPNPAPYFPSPYVDQQPTIFWPHNSSHSMVNPQVKNFRAISTHDRDARFMSSESRTLQGQQLARTHAPWPQRPDYLANMPEAARIDALGLNPRARMPPLPLKLRPQQAAPLEQTDYLVGLVQGASTWDTNPITRMPPFPSNSPYLKPQGVMPPLTRQGGPQVEYYAYSTHGVRPDTWDRNPKNTRTKLPPLPPNPVDLRPQRVAAQDGGYVTYTPTLMAAHDGKIPYFKDHIGTPSVQQEQSSNQGMMTSVRNHGASASFDEHPRTNTNFTSQLQISEAGGARVRGRGEIVEGARLPRPTEQNKSYDDKEVIVIDSD